MNLEYQSIDPTSTDRGNCLFLAESLPVVQLLYLAYLRGAQPYQAYPWRVVTKLIRKKRHSITHLKRTVSWVVQNMYIWCLIWNVGT